MPTHAQMLAEKQQQKGGDRFAPHAHTAGMLFYRDVINKEAMARDKFEADPPTDYEVRHLWRAVTGRRDERMKFSKECRNWAVDYPWTSARVDRADVDGLHHGSGVRTFHNKRDTWYNVLHRDATALSRFHRDKADRPPSPGHMPRYLDSHGHTVSRQESARVREALRATAMAHGDSARRPELGHTHNGGSGQPRHTRPGSACLSGRSAMRSTRGRFSGAGIGAGDNTSQVWAASRSKERYAKDAVRRAIREKRAQRRGGGMSDRSGASARSNTWLALGHTSRSTTARSVLGRPRSAAQRRSTRVHPL